MSEFLQLGEHISIQKGKPPLLIPFHGKGAEIYLSPEYLRNRTVGISAKASSDAVRVSDGATVLLWDGSNAGEFFKAKEGIVASTMARITPDENFYQAFFFHLLKHAERILKNQTNGTGIPHVDKEILENISAFCPSDSQQRKIAEVLDTLDTAIHQTEAIVEKLKQVKQGLLHDLLTRGVDVNGELRPSYEEAPELYKESPLGWIPKEWDVMCLGSIATSSVIGPFGSNLVATDYRTSGVPVVFVRDVRDTGFEWNSFVYITQSKAAALAVHDVIPGDVLATKMGLPPCVSAVYPDWMPQGIITADILRFRVDKNKYRPSWVSHCINETAVVKQVETITAGVTRPKVTLRDARELQLRIPPVLEQDRILERLDAMGEKIRLESDQLAKLKAEKMGLMDDLLTGRVRVTPLLAQ